MRDDQSNINAESEQHRQATHTDVMIGEHHDTLWQATHVSLLSCEDLPGCSTVPIRNRGRRRTCT